MTIGGRAIENISSQFGLHQVISETTYILESYFSCIDLIFTSEPNCITESGFHPSLHPSSLSLSLYLRKFFIHHLIFVVWHYQDPNIDLIRQAVDIFDWDTTLVNTSVNEKAFTFNRTILNILSSFIPQEILIVHGNKEL